MRQTMPIKTFLLPAFLTSVPQVTQIHNLISKYKQVSEIYYESRRETANQNLLSIKSLLKTTIF